MHPHLEQSVTVTCIRVLKWIYVHSKFEVSRFIHSKDMIHTSSMQIAGLGTRGTGTAVLGQFL